MLYAGAMADGPKSGGRWGDLVALGIGATAIAYWRFAPEDMPTLDGLMAIGGALAFSVLFFGGIHLLLKRWDGWRGR